MFDDVLDQVSDRHARREKVAKKLKLKQLQRLRAEKKQQNFKVRKDRCQSHRTTRTLCVTSSLVQQL